MGVTEDDETNTVATTASAFTGVTIVDNTAASCNNKVKKHGCVSRQLPLLPKVSVTFELLKKLF